MKQTHLGIGDLRLLVKDIRVTSKALDALPDDQEISQDDASVLDDLRIEAFELTRVIDTIFEGLRGTT